MLTIVRPPGVRALLAAAIASALACVAPEPPSDDDDGTEAPSPTPVEGEPAGWFFDRTEASGVDFEAPEPAEPPETLVDLTTGGGGVLADLDGDGAPDLLLTAPFGDSALYLQGPPGVFEEVELELEERRPTYGAAAADLDGDGLREVFLFERDGVRLLHNLGAARFDDRGHVFGAWRDTSPVGGTLADLDGDGRVDLVLAVQSREAEGLLARGAHLRLLRGRPGFVFEDVTEASISPRPPHSQTYIVGLLDADDDGRLDLYAVNDHGVPLHPNELYLNRGEGRFVEASAAHGLDLAINGMGFSTGELDDVEGPEIAMSDTQSRVHVVSLREGYGTEITQAVGAVPRDRERFTASWATEMADLDHDGRLDLLVAWGAKGLDRKGLGEPQGISTWLNNGAGGRLQDVTGPDPVPSSTWRTAMVADIDGDGALDAVHSSLVGPVSVRTGRHILGRRWLEVALLGPPGNRDGLGAVVELSGPAGRQRRIVHAGGSGLHSSVEPVAHFGLGEDPDWDTIRVVWPDGSVDAVEVGALDRRVTVEQGAR